MIRPATAADLDVFIRLGVRSGLFPEDQTAALRDAMLGVLSGNAGPDHRAAVLEEGGVAVGVVYFALDAMAAGKWDVWMIAVDPDVQRRAHGSRLLEHAERAATAAGGRLVLIDTSSLARFDPARAFYARHGYAEVARIADYYRDGEARVTVAKRLRPRGGG